MGACRGPRLPRIVPVLIAILASAFAGCFRHPDVGKMNCVVEKGCPHGYVCIVSGAAGRCERPSDGGDTSRLPGPDATAIDAPGDTALGRDAVDADGGALIDSRNVADRVGVDATAADLPIMDPDVPLVADGGLGTGGAGGSGMGGAIGTGGSTTVDAPGVGGAPGTGGIASSGGAPGTGGMVSSGGAPGTGGMVSFGGAPGTGGIVSSGGAPGTGGIVSSGGAPGTGGMVSSGGTPGTGGTTLADAAPPSGCVGNPWPTADPTAAGPFQVKAEKGVGPYAGYIPDPIYKDKQQQFNIYRPTTLETSEYCHPILVWSNGYTDNPEQNPPDCVVDPPSNKFCGQYLPVMQHLASHGFVVIASLSTTTLKGDPLPSITGLNWLLEQAEDPESAYYHRLDTAHIGAFGHSAGGMATCMMAKDPRFSAISTVSGVATISAIHAPALFFCGGKETNFNPPTCDANLTVASTITTQPSMLINAVDEDHASWAYDGASGVAISGFAAWFRLHLMGDTAQRQRFYGDGCTFCTDSRVEVLHRNSLMSQ